MSSHVLLLEALDEVGRAVEFASQILLLLDFDGTLAPIVEKPELARLPSKTRDALERLVRRDEFTVGIVSGRSLEDVRSRVGIDGLVYAGNHGLEIEGLGLRLEEPTVSGLEQAIEQVVEALQGRLGDLPGVLVESKRLTASVHHRLVPDEYREEVDEIVRSVVPDDHPGLLVAAGKRVWEVRPRIDWNKGTAIRWIRDRLGLQGALTFYFGDDRTDEDAFRELGQFVTARVGSPSEPTQAGFRIANTVDVAEFLDWLSRLVYFTDPPESISRLSPDRPSSSTPDFSTKESP